MSAIEATINLPKLGLLDDSTTKDLIYKAQAGDIAAKDKLVQHNLRLVYSIALRLKRPGIELEDLFQVGCLGLMKAIDDFDLSYNVRFSTYAVPVIAGEIKRLIREDGLIKVSRSTKRLGQLLMSTRERLSAELSREPTVHELAAAVGVSPEEAVEALEASLPVSSLHERIGSPDGGLEIEDMIAAGSDPESAVVDSVSLKNALSQLSERERRILLMRYLEEKTQAEVAKVIGVSQVQISRIEKRILAALKDSIER